MIVNYYATLRQVVGSCQVAFVLPQGGTLRQLVEEMIKRFPGLKKILDPQGNLYGHIHIFVNGHDFSVSGEALAAADGKVAFMGNYSNTLGRVVEIYHPNGFLTRYAHLAAFESGLEVGSQVNAGQAIGTIGGSTVVAGSLIDNYWGTHLHFSVFRWTSTEWHVTDPFSWDPWAGPDQQSNLTKQSEDPLINCNGEVSYDLWVEAWPQPYGGAVATTSFHPAQDRFVGGWLGEAPANLP